MFGSTVKWRSLATTVRSHYDSLGITPRATQADVKAAYYKFSKMYHPDTAHKDDRDASLKFRQVTEAYEILGNVKLRRLYDKGMTNISASAFHKPVYEEEDPTIKFHRSREVRSRPPPPTGRTPIYDYDEWSRTHYGEAFARDMKRKRDLELKERVRLHERDFNKIERVLFVMLVLIGTGIVLTSENRKYDRVVVRKTDQDR